MTARVEKEHNRIKAMSQLCQVQWAMGQTMVNRPIIWCDVVNPTNYAQFSNQIHVQYPTKLCNLLCCCKDTATGCKTAQLQSHYRWRQNQVLKKLAEVLEKQTGFNTITKIIIYFVRSCQLTPQKHWEIQKLSRHHHIPKEITLTSLQSS